MDIVTSWSGTDAKPFHADGDADATFGKIKPKWSRLDRLSNVEWHARPHHCNGWMLQEFFVATNGFVIEEFFFYELGRVSCQHHLIFLVQLPGTMFLVRKGAKVAQMF